VCGLDFEERYGKLGKGFIHVHHIVEISKIGKKYKVDPKKDLRPVCPNCHAMLHRNFKVMSIDGLKAILAARS
jgi:5-methylcytosine-specific restriction protein A